MFLLSPASAQNYLLTNDDSAGNGVSFYAIGSDGTLTYEQRVQGPGIGAFGGLFGLLRLAVVNNAENQCIFASEAYTNDVMWIVPGSPIVGGSAKGSTTDDGSANGIALAANSKYVYAGFSASNTIATFRIKDGCFLRFKRDVAVSGLNNGPIDGMAVHGNILIATYADGTIESFDIAGGIPLSNGDKQLSTASATGQTYPNGIDITQDGHFVIFGDTSTSDAVEVSDISSGRLMPTTVFQPNAGISSSNVLLSPDETILYISNTQSASVTAAFFDASTGKLTPGCTSRTLKGYVKGFSYLGSMALQQVTGNGGGVYVAEFGTPSLIGIVNLEVTKGKCKLKESAASPVVDSNSLGLLSVGRFPPRSF